MLLPFDLFSDLSTWTALTPSSDPSTDLALALADGRVDGRPSIEIESTFAQDHRVVASFDFLDLEAFDDLQFWVKASAASDPGSGFVAELSFGATNLSLTAPSNTWRRYIPISKADTWELVTVDITDFPGRVRSRCNQMQIRVTQSRSFSLHIAEVSALDERPIADAETALTQLLDGVLTLEDPVTAVLAPDATPAEPHFLIRPISVTSATERMRSGERRTDFDETGFLSRPPIEPLDLAYAIDVVADQREQQQAMADFLLSHIPSHGYLEVNGAPASLMWNGDLTTRGDPGVQSAPILLTVPRAASFDRRRTTRPFAAVVVAVDQP